MSDLIEQLAMLFTETGEAHQQAFLATDGADPEWPLWFAEYLRARLPGMLGAELTTSELVYLLIRMDMERRDEAPETSWQQYNARWLAERYGTA